MIQCWVETWKIFGEFTKRKKNFHWQKWHVVYFIWMDVSVTIAGVAVALFVGYYIGTSSSSKNQPNQKSANQKKEAEPPATINEDVHHQDVPYSDMGEHKMVLQIFVQFVAKCPSKKERKAKISSCVYFSTYFEDVFDFLFLFTISKTGQSNSLWSKQCKTMQSIKMNK